VTLAELREGDHALRAYVARRSPNVTKPLGLVGPFGTDTTVMNDECDYWLLDDKLRVALTPDMNGWDVMRALAAAWKAWAVMDGFIFSGFRVVEESPGWLSVNLWADVDVLNEQQLDAMRELEARQKAIEGELRALQPVPRLAPEVVEDRLADWRRLLRQSVTQGRAVLQRILKGRIVFTPREAGYEFNCETRYDKLFTGVR
jgi:hypothetical protein